MSAFGHRIIIVVLSGKLECQILQEGHVRSRLMTQAMYRSKPASPFPPTSICTPRDIVLEREPRGWLEGALPLGAEPLVRIAEEPAL